jgi:glycosyltransferase involved in cell wall biosynthesis
MHKNRTIVMLGTTPDSYGGIASVISVYQETGLFRRLKVIYLPTHCTGTPIKKIEIFAMALAKLFYLLFLRRVSLVHIHVACGTSFWRKTVFLALAKVFLTPTILHVHAGRFPDFYNSECGFLGRSIIAAACKGATEVVAVSEALNKWMRLTFGLSNVTTLWNPIPTTIKTQSRLRDRATLLFLGHLSVQKGVFDLLLAMPRILETHPDAKLKLCGDGNVEITEQYVRELNLSNSVSVTGWIDQIKRSELLSIATILVLPSHAEGFPMSILEAMSAGTPVVATRVGGVPEAITHEREGLLVTPGDVAGIAESIKRLLASPWECRRMGQLGRLKTESHFASEKMVMAVETLYEQK